MPWGPTTITVKYAFAGVHRWPKATGRHDYLANSHRHVFFVDATLTVYHDDRELEFLDVQDTLHAYIGGWPYDLGEMSCESMAREVVEALLTRHGDRLMTVTVSEDGENGATVRWCPAQMRPKPVEKKTWAPKDEIDL